MSSFFKGILGGVVSMLGMGEEDNSAQEAADRQAAEIRKASEAQARQASLTAKAAQIQQEGIASRLAAEQRAQSLAQAPAPTPDVETGVAPTAPEDAPRRAFQKKKPTTAAAAGINI